MKLDKKYRNLKFKQFQIIDCYKHKFFLSFLRRKKMRQEYEKHKVNKEKRKNNLIETENSTIQADLEDIKELPINKNWKNSGLVDISFWILGKLSINLNDKGEIDAFQILPETKNVLFELPEGTHIQRISETEFILVKDLVN